MKEILDATRDQLHNGKIHIEYMGSIQPQTNPYIICQYYYDENLELK